MISDSTIQEILNKADIVEIIGETVDLKASGPNNKGCCPFHDEKTPSFNVNSVRQTYHCFGCGVGGDVFSFLQRQDGLSFPEAVRRVGAIVGVKVEDRELTPEEKRLALEQDRIFEINDLAHEYYCQTLEVENVPGGPIEQELQRLSVTDELAKEFGFGLALDQWEGLMAHLKSQGVTIDEMAGAGLLQQKKSKKGYYDMLRNRLPFPARNMEGRILGFIGKSLDEKVKLKFLSTGASSVFDREKHLLGLFQAKHAIRKKGEVIIVQRIVDMFVLRKAGFDNVVVPCGGSLKDCHVDLLKKLATKAYLLYSQNPWSPQRAFADMAPLLERGLSVAGVAIPNGDLPAKFINTQGPEGLVDLIDQANPILEAYIDATLGAIDPADKRPTEAVQGIIKALRLLPSILERALYAKDVSSRTSFRESDLVNAALKES